MILCWNIGTPYRPELAKEYEEKGYWKKENFSQVFDNIAERFWEREALVGGDQRYTYGELKKGTDRLALHFNTRSSVTKIGLWCSS